MTYDLQHTRVRDAQNPYRTGVLIGNYTEDRFGRMLAQQPVSCNFFLIIFRKRAELDHLKTKCSTTWDLRSWLMSLNRAPRRQFSQRSNKRRSSRTLIRRTATVSSRTCSSATALPARTSRSAISAPQTTVCTIRSKKLTPLSTLTFTQSTAQSATNTNATPRSKTSPLSSGLAPTPSRLNPTLTPPSSSMPTGIRPA